MKKLKAGIIGLGRIASLYELDKNAKKYYPYLTHAGTYVKHPKIDLVCGADIDRHKLRQFKKMWGIKSLYTDYAAMLKKEKVDILSICTPPEAHNEIIRKAAKDAKVIFCEKPFMNNSREIKEIIKLKNRTNTKITVNLYREYDKSHIKVKELIKSGTLGRVQRVNCYYGKGLRNMGTHVLAYLLGILGIPEKLVFLGKKRFQGVKEFTYDIYFEFKKGIPAFIQSCDFNRFRLFELDFICEKGRIQILEEGLSIKKFRTKKNKAETGSRELGEKEYLKSTIGDAFYSAVEHLIELCTGKKSVPIMSPEKYLGLQLLIDKIEKNGEKL